jgi:hypothetical protein
VVAEIGWKIEFERLPEVLDNDFELADQRLGWELYGRKNG